MRYFITFSCYGAHLHGEAGAVDRRHNLPGSRFLEPDPQRESAERKKLDQLPFTLDSISRETVLLALQDVALHRGWSLLAAHVRTNHVHTIVEADARPEKVMSDFKSYASRALNNLGHDGPDRKRWAHHGSTRWLWKDQDVREAIVYVVEGQGEPMSVFLADEI